MLVLGLLWLGHEYSTYQSCFLASFALLVDQGSAKLCCGFGHNNSKTHFLPSFSILDQGVPNQGSAISCCVWT
jgi:hypothetical protein